MPIRDSAEDGGEHRAEALATADQPPHVEGVRAEPQCLRGGVVPDAIRPMPMFTAPTISFATSPTRARSPIIWNMTRTLEVSVVGVMSPNPTVENTVTVK